RRLDQADENSRKLTFTAQVNAGNIFVPATQPGSVLDWDIDADAFANRVMTLRQDFSSAKPATISHAATAKNPIVPIELALAGNLNLTGSGLLFSLDDKTRPVAINRFLLPWASASPDKSVETTPLVRTDVKG